mmetsp:Transcript_68649/g.108894  ORF Transcript_68649/g.108894 Transcript_68649/m.108894 type:complete len:232 (+) Transcript_68649:52-747(+)
MRGQTIVADDIHHRCWDSDEDSDTCSDIGVKGESKILQDDTQSTHAATNSEDARSIESAQESLSADRGSGAQPNKFATMVCSICRDMTDDRLVCVTCPDHVVCFTCHCRFANQLWHGLDHEFVPLAGIAQSAAPLANDVPKEQELLDSIDFNALLALEPSLGSIHHNLGNCHPCHYAFSRVGCRYGKMCGLCHHPHKRNRGSKPRGMEKKMAQLPVDQLPQGYNFTCLGRP